MTTCATCGRENPPDAGFCNGCGAPLAGPAPRREERKVVTVFFADLVGFTSRAEQLDPEDVRTLLASYWRHVRDELEHYGGTVEKFIGDAVMALFGAPVAHEDDPERAVRAALAIRDWARETPDVQIRVAVNTGEALVLLGAKASEGEGMAAGDIVNTTARLQTAAPVNGVLVGKLTYRATRHVIDYVEREAVVAKGKAEPLPVWEAVGARSRFTVEAMSAAPLAGREDEVELLVNTFQRVRRDREPQLVTVAGVPGIGKSRLVAELFSFVDADPGLVTWRRGRSLSYGDGVSLWALGEIAKAELGVLESDTREETAAKLARSLAELIEKERERAWLARHLAPLLGLPAEHDDRTERFGAWRRWIELLADRRPLVLVFEDLQWADDELLDFVDELADWATDVPLLVVCTTRPELHERRPGWGGGKRNVLTVSLGPLSDVDTARIVAATLDRKLLPAETQAALLERAAGNPLYAEQYARMVAERGRPDELPDSVQGIVAARLDLLAPEEKALLQDASVVGRVFWPGALGAADGLLRSLVRKEFIRRERHSSVADEQECSFAHALVRDVAYAQIPRGDRAAKHRGAAAWLESLPPDRAADRAEMVAHHYGAALELAQLAGGADGELRRRARDAFREAGARSASLNALATAERNLSSALELFDADDEERPYVLLELGRVVAERDPVGGRPLLEEAAAALSAVGDGVAAASAEVACARACFYGGQRQAADRHSQQALALLEHEPLSEVKVDAFAERARLLMLSGAYAEAAELATAGLELAARIEAERPQASLLITRGTALGSRDDIERGLAVAERAKDLLQLSRGFNNLAELVIESGDLAAAFEVYARQRREFGQLGLSAHLVWLDVQEASIAGATGAWDRTLELLDPILARLDAGSTMYLEGDARLTRARIREARGDTHAALADARRGLLAARSAKDPQALIPGLGSTAGLLLHAGRWDEARSLLEEALALSRGLAVPYYTMAPSLLVAVLDLALQNEFLEVFGPHAERDPWTRASVLASGGDLPGAAEAFADLGGRTIEADIRLRAAADLRARGDGTAADEQLQAALAFFRSVGATQRILDAGELLSASA